MPVPQREAILGVLLLSISVPVQYYLVTQSTWSSKDRTSAWNSLAEKVKKVEMVMVEKVKKVASWYGDWADWLDQMAVAGEDAEEEDQPVLMVGMKGADGAGNVSVTEGYFTTSTKPRTRRPEEVLFRVGEVVIHKTLEIRGVIMGWDEAAKAPMIWLNQVYGNDETMAKQPHYTVICDIRNIDDIESEVHYFPQARLKSDSTGGRVINPMLDVLFKDYSVELGRYIMKPHLKKLYPKD